MALDDLVGSFRSIGILGAVLGSIVVAFFVLFGSLALNKEYAGGGKTIEFRFSKNQKKLATLKERKITGEERIAAIEQLELKAADLATLELAVQKQAAANAQAKSELAATSDHILETVEALDDYKTRHRNHVRNQAVGTTFEELKTTDGKAYHHARITQITAMGIDVTHRGGSGRIPFKNLPAEIQTKYMYTEEEAQAQQKREIELYKQRLLAQQSALRNRRLLADQAADRAAQQRQDEASKHANHQKEADFEQQRQIEKLAQAINVMNQRISHTQNQIRIESTKKISRAPQYRKELKQLQAAKNDYEARLRELRAGG